MSKNQEYNYAGKTIVVDSIVELKKDRSSTKSSYIRQVVKSAQNTNEVKKVPYELQSVMSDQDNGSATITLYKGGELFTDPVYIDAKVYNGSTWVAFAGLTGMMTGGTKTSSYTFAQAFQFKAFNLDQTQVLATGYCSCGKQGLTGDNGYNTAQIRLLKRANSQPSNYNGGAVTYAFATGGVTFAGGSSDGWSVTPPAGSGDLYVIYASAHSQSATDVIQPNEFSEPVILSEEAVQGESGYSVATVFIYQRSASTPTLPSASVTYAFEGGAISGLNNGWTKDIPSGTDKIWISQATAFSKTSSDTILSTEWSTPQVLAQNGPRGAAFITGVPGSTFSGTLANWQSWASSSHTWTGITNASSMQAGDTLELIGTITDKGNAPVIFVGVISSVSGTSVTTGATSSIVYGQLGEEYLAFKIVAKNSTIIRDDERRDSQTIVLSTDINGYTSPAPRFEISGFPRMCGYHTGDTKSTLISDLKDMIENETSYTPSFSGTNNWSRGGSLFSVDDIVSIVYYCSDLSYVTALMSVTSVGTTTVTGKVISYLYTIEGFDDRDTDNVLLYVPYKEAVPLTVTLADGAQNKDTLTLEVRNDTRSRKSFHLTVPATVPFTTTAHTETVDGIVYTYYGDYYTVNNNGSVEEYNYVEGDSYIVVGQGTDPDTNSPAKAVTIYMYVNGWTIASRDYNRYDEILTDSLPDVFAQYQSMNHVVAAGYDWFKQIVAQYISATYYFVKGAIYGYGSGGSVDMTKSAGQRATGQAFIIDSDGIMEISEGYATGLTAKNLKAENIKLTGTLDMRKEGDPEVAVASILHPSFSTYPFTPGDSSGITINSPSSSYDPTIPASKLATANTLINAGINGTYKGYSISKMVKVTNPSTVMVSSRSGSSGEITPASDGGTYTASYSFTITNDSNWPSNAVPVSVTISNTKTNVAAMSLGFSAVMSVGGTIIDSVSEPIAVPKSATLSGTVHLGDTVTITATARFFVNTNWTSMRVSWSTSNITLTDLGLSANGLWLYSNSSWSNLGTSAITESTNRFVISTPIYYDSQHFVLPSNLYNYTSYTYSGTTYNIDPNLAYKAGGSLVIDGNSCTPYTICRNYEDSVFKSISIHTDIGTFTFTDGEQYYISGSIKVLGSPRGLVMEGCYPKRTYNDPSGGFDCGSTGLMWNNGFFYICNSYDFNTLSTEESKHHIQPYTEKAMDILNKTEIVTYTYKDDPNDTWHIGFIADYTPWEIAGPEHNKMILNHCVGMLIKAAQENCAEIEKLKAEIEKLKAERQNN